MVGRCSHQNRGIIRKLFFRQVVVQLNVSSCNVSGSVGGGICHLFSIARTAIIQDEDFRHIFTTLVYVSEKFINRDDSEKTWMTRRLACAEKRLRGFFYFDFMIMFQPTIAPMMSTMAIMIVKY